MIFSSLSLSLSLSLFSKKMNCDQIEKITKEKLKASGFTLCGFTYNTLINKAIGALEGESFRTVPMIRRISFFEENMKEALEVHIYDLKNKNITHCSGFTVTCPEIKVMNEKHFIIDFYSWGE